MDITVIYEEQRKESDKWYSFESVQTNGEKAILKDKAGNKVTLEGVKSVRVTDKEEWDN